MAELQKIECGPGMSKNTVSLPVLFY